MPTRTENISLDTAATQDEDVQRESINPDKLFCPHAKDTSLRVNRPAEPVNPTVVPGQGEGEVMPEEATLDQVGHAHPSRTGRQRPAQLVPGELALCDGAIVEVIALGENYNLLVRDRQTGAVSLTNAWNLEKLGGTQTLGPDTAKKDAEKLLARQRFDVISALCTKGPPTRAELAAAAHALSIGPRQLQRKLKDFAAQGTIEVFERRKRGRKRGTTLLSPEAEALLQRVIEPRLRRSADITVSYVYPLIQKECLGLGIRAPSDKTVQRRLTELKKNPELLPSEPARELRRREAPIKQHFCVARPLEVVQIDHTPLDVMAVSAMDRKPFRRPYLTVAVDVHTRCVIGMHIGYDAPSALTVALCLLNAVQDKSEMLRSLDIQQEWPMRGLMEIIHTDNASEFVSLPFAQSCNHWGITVNHRPIGRPQYGGHVERAQGTINRQAQLLPGTTYSKALGGRPRKTEQNAALTLDEIQAVITRDFIRYHENRHRELGCPPRVAWEQAWQNGKPSVPRDEREFFLRFLPSMRRTIDRGSIRFHNLEYTSLECKQLSQRGVQRFIRFDPRDIRQVYLEHPNGTVVEVPVRDRAMPKVSFHDYLDWNRRKLLQDRPRNSAVIAELIEANERTIDNAVRARNRARKERTLAWSRQYPSPSTEHRQPEPPPSFSDDAESLHPPRVNWQDISTDSSPTYTARTIVPGEYQPLKTAKTDAHQDWFSALAGTAMGQAFEQEKSTEGEEER